MSLRLWFSLSNDVWVLLRGGPVFLSTFLLPSYHVLELWLPSSLLGSLFTCFSCTSFLPGWQVEFARGQIQQAPGLVRAREALLQLGM